MASNNRNDLTGKVFGRLKVVKYSHTSNDGKWRAFWVCQCKCGKKKTVAGRHLTSGSIVSCGCLKSDQMRQKVRTHGMSGTPTYNVWCHMIRRCTDPKTPGFHRWGGRGVSVCKRWLKFENFFADMGSRPKNKTLDRIDNNGHYEPKNCRWATIAQQSANRTSRKGLKRNSRVPVVESKELQETSA